MSNPLPRIIKTDAPLDHHLNPFEVQKFLQSLVERVVSLELTTSSTATTARNTASGLASLGKTVGNVTSTLNTAIGDIATTTATVAGLATTTVDVLVDFGPLPPGSSDVTVFVATPDVKAASEITVEVLPDATADHAELEGIYEGLSGRAYGIIDGVGFTLAVHSPLTSHGTYLVRTSW